MNSFLVPSFNYMTTDLSSFLFVSCRYLAPLVSYLAIHLEWAERFASNQWIMRFKNKFNSIANWITIFTSTQTG